MSKKVTKRSIDGVNKTRSCACKLKYLLLYKIFWNFFFFFFFFTFPKKMGRSDNGKRNILWGWPNEAHSAESCCPTL